MYSKKTPDSSMIGKAADEPLRDKKYVSYNEYEQLELQLKEESEKVTIAYRLLSILGRDIRTHLHSILGLSEIYMNALEHSPRTAGELFERIYVSESIMQDILNDILELSEMVHDTETPEQDLISLNDMLIHLDRPVENRLELKDIHFISESINVQNSEFYADQRILNEILLKALKLMIHYSLPGAGITLRVKEIANSETSSLYEFNFRSDKCDVQRERLMGALEPFTSMLREVQKDMDQVDLCIISLKRFVEILGGDIVVYKTDPDVMDVSVQFRFSLPKREDLQDVSGKEPSESSQYYFKDKTALIIDDDVINLEVNVRMLEQMGLKAIGVTSGREGAEVFQKLDGKVDIVFLDIRMPGFTGIEVAQRIREAVAMADLPVIAISSNSTREDLELSREAGMNEHLIKPINPHDLYDVLKKYF